MQNEQSFLGEEGWEKDAGGGSFPVPEGVPRGSESADECAIPAEMRVRNQTP
jgi:hypothetical protein